MEQSTNDTMDNYIIRVYTSRMGEICIYCDKPVREHIFNQIERPYTNTMDDDPRPAVLRGYFLISNIDFDSAREIASKFTRIVLDGVLDDSYGRLVEISNQNSVFFKIVRNGSFDEIAIRSGEHDNDYYKISYVDLHNILVSLN